MSNWSLRDGWKAKDKRPESVTESYIITKVTRLAESTYITKVDGIPDGRIEHFLFRDGRAMVWKSPTFGWIVTACEVTGYDYAGYPNRFRANFEGQQYENFERPELTELDDCVVFFDTLNPNICRRQCLVWTGDYADTTETIRTQVFNQKTPLIGVVGNPSIKAKLKDAFVSLADNVKMLFLDEDIKDKVQTFNFDSPYNVESLLQYRKSLENEMLEYCGIDSQDAFHKKERMIVDEQEGNDELLNYMLSSCLKAREIACEKLTSKGINATVEICPLVRPIQEIEEFGGVEDVDGTNQV